jgi:hypothetical protein
LIVVVARVQVVGSLDLHEVDNVVARVQMVGSPSLHEVDNSSCKSSSGRQSKLTGSWQ